MQTNVPTRTVLLTLTRVALIRVSMVLVLQKHTAFIAAVTVTSLVSTVQQRSMNAHRIRALVTGSVWWACSSTRACVVMATRDLTVPRA